LRPEWEGRMDLRYILGILNSRPTSYLYRTWAHEKGRTFAQAKIFRTKQIPIPGIDVKYEHSSEIYDRIVGLVEDMLHSKVLSAKAKAPVDKTSVERQIQTIDNQIDQLVYELYSLSEQEIGIVEDATR
jgi:hypothetical protein